MELFEYIRDRQQPLVLYRVMERTSGYVEAQLTDAPEAERPALAEDIRALLRMKGKPPVFQLYRTPPMWYPEREDDRIVDIVVLGLGEETTARVYKEELEKAAARRQQLQAWFELNVRKYLDDLTAQPWLLAVLKRGDWVHPRRYCTPESDIDLFLLVDFEQDDMEMRTKLYEELRRCPGEVYMDYTWLDFEDPGVKAVSEAGDIITDSELIKPADHESDMKVDISVFSLPTMIRYREAKLYQARLYYLEAVKQVDYFYTDGRAAQKFLRLVRQ